MRVRSINSFIFPLVQLQSLRNMGFIKVNYPTTLLRNAIEKIHVGKTGKVILMTHDGNSVLDQNLSEDGDMLKKGLQQIDTRFNENTSGIFPMDVMGETNLLFSASCLHRIGRLSEVCQKQSCMKNHSHPTDDACCYLFVAICCDTCRFLVVRRYN